MNKVMTLDDYRPAFPTMTHHGMSLRDYFSAKAMNGLLASYPKGIDWDLKDIPYKEWANFSYKMADAMLKAREVTHA